MASELTSVDSAIPRFNQACVAVLTGSAFILGWWPIVPAVATVLTVTRLGGHRYGLFSRIYEGFVRPQRVADPIMEPAAPPRFAMTVASIALWIASGGFLIGAMTVGWGVTLVVTAMSAFAAATSICVACRVYEGLTS